MKVYLRPNGWKETTVNFSWWEVPLVGYLLRAMQQRWYDRRFSVPRSDTSRDNDLVALTRLINRWGHSKNIILDEADIVLILDSASHGGKWRWLWRRLHKRMRQ